MTVQMEAELGSLHEDHTQYHECEEALAVAHSLGYPTEVLAGSKVYQLVLEGGVSKYQSLERVKHFPMFASERAAWEWVLLVWFRRWQDRMFPEGLLDSVEVAEMAAEDPQAAVEYLLDIGYEAKEQKLPRGRFIVEPVEVLGLASSPHFTGNRQIAVFSADRARLAV